MYTIHFTISKGYSFSFILKANQFKWIYFASNNKEFHRNPISKMRIFFSKKNNILQN